MHGCGWVRWGVGSMGGHKNKSKRAKNGCAGYIFGHMTGEISPDITFVRIWRICVLMGVGGQICVPKGEWGAGTGAERKTTGKEAKMIVL